MAKSRTKAEYGDFQTPSWLCEQVCARLKKLGVLPATIFEPTCGNGNFIAAAYQAFENATNILGLDINPHYVQTAKEQLGRLIAQQRKTQTDLRTENFFSLDGQSLLAGAPAPLLVIGNPPWVTNTVLAALNSINQPQKSNFQQRSGIEAITGASNFDVSEWMILKLLEWTDPATTDLAMLCKTSVARKILLHCWQGRRAMGECHIYSINAQQAFGATVDACLLFIGADSHMHSQQVCSVYENLDAVQPMSRVAFRDQMLIADLEKYKRWQHLMADGDREQHPCVWRSGIKHDCSPVMELVRCGQDYHNKLGDMVQLENEVLFPLYKATDLTNGRGRQKDRWMLVTQMQVGVDTRPLRNQAPMVWEYLVKHGTLLDNRQSTIYHGQPRFAIFGVGNYSFAPWKVAISGMHKMLQFVVVGPVEGKAAVLDDTCYFLPCATQSAAEFTAELLNSDIAREFFEAFIFWRDKRPITARLLRRLDIASLAYELGRERDYTAVYGAYDTAPDHSNGQQLKLLEKRANKSC